MICIMVLIIAPQPPLMSGDGKDSEKYGRIMLSDVVVKRRKNVFRGRKWTTFDVGTIGMLGALHLLCAFAPFTFTWDAFWLAFGLHLVTGLGITLSYHRNLSHRSFKVPKLLEYFFAYCGAQAIQGDPMSWVSNHRYHHQFVDSEKDPHSPTKGFWHSHITWFLDQEAINQWYGRLKNVGDLRRQPYYKFLRRTYPIHPILLGAMLYALGGFPYLVWGMGVRTVYVYHITWCVNSVCHIWGKRAWNTNDLSRNNWLVAVLAAGEGWHNNHHAFEYSARQGLEWWQIDITWYVIWLLQAIGLATDVKFPSPAQMKKKEFIN